MGSVQTIVKLYAVCDLTCQPPDTPLAFDKDMRGAGIVDDGCAQKSGRRGTQPPVKYLETHGAPVRVYHTSLKSTQSTASGAVV